MNLNKYIQTSKNGKRYCVVFPSGIKSPRRLGRYDTIEQARRERDKYLDSLSPSRQTDKTKLDTPNHFFLVAFADTHAGHNQGLMNPNVVLDDDGMGWQPKPTKMQEWLWSFYQDAMDKVFDIVGDNELILAHVGDLTQGIKYKENLVSTRQADQLKIAYSNIKPWFKRGVRKAVILKGTSSHAFGDGTSDLLITEWLKAKYDKAIIKTVYHALLQLGIEIDMAHHGPHPGTRNWTKGNVARYYLLDRILESITSEQKPSRVYLRAHYHTFVWESLYRYGSKSDLIVLPSMCGLGAYGRQATKSVSHTSHGLVLFEIENGRLKDTMPIVQKRDARVKVYL